jgi:hypothetical protein
LIKSPYLRLERTTSAIDTTTTMIKNVRIMAAPDFPGGYVHAGLPTPAESRDGIRIVPVLARLPANMTQPTETGGHVQSPA